jgi:hypothetical protein
LDGTKGALLLPKVDALSAIATPVKGMLVYLNLQDGDYAANKVYIYDGTWNVYAGPAGAKGDQGIQGPAGTNGTNGATGDKGDKGDKGDQGIQGPIGPTGPVGEQGVQGETGPEGTAGANSIHFNLIWFTTTESHRTIIANIPSACTGQNIWLRSSVYMQTGGDRYIVSLGTDHATAYYINASGEYDTSPVGRNFPMPVFCVY